MWQALRTELHPLGVEIVTVGIDAAGPEACRPFIEAAQPEHPSLVDTTHRMAELFGVINIPNGVWIDEEGMIVRPAEPASPHPPSAERPYRPVEGLPEHMNEVLDEASRIKVDGRYVDMLRDWARAGRREPVRAGARGGRRAVAAARSSSGRGPGPPRARCGAVGPGRPAVAPRRTGARPTASTP